MGVNSFMYISVDVNECHVKLERWAIADFLKGSNFVFASSIRPNSTDTQTLDHPVFFPLKHHHLMLLTTEGGGKGNITLSVSWVHERKNDKLDYY